MAAASGLADHFLALHVAGRPLLMPNAWDAGSAGLLESIGYGALASTSSGFAATLGRLDGSISRDEALEHCTSLAAAVGVPVSADLENGFADEPEEVGETVRRALDTGLAGCSIEDFSGDTENPIYPLDLAVARVRAAAEAAHEGEHRLVLTARAENLIHGRDDLDDTIERLLAYERSGADVLFAPGLRELDQIRTVVEAVAKPLSVLALPGGPDVAQLAEAGVSRVSVGGAFAYAALGALVEAATELREHGTYGYWERAGAGLRAAREAFGAGTRLS